MRIEHALLAVFIVAFVIVIGTSAYAISQANQSVADNEQAKSIREAILLLESIHNSLLEAESASRAYALTDEGVFLEEFNTDKVKLFRHIDTLVESGTQASQQRTLTNELRTGVRERINVAAALANIALREALRLQNIRDPLTNLYNRRYLEETMEREVLLTQRRKSSIGIIMLDIDHFKNFNDTHGHQAGDQLLKAFAAYLGQKIRGEDIVCRYGGEEFIIVLPGADMTHTLERAEQLRSGMHSVRTAVHGEELPGVSCSFGVACYPQHGSSWQDVMHQADLALYRAKRAGRDRVLGADAPDITTDQSTTD